MTAKKLKAARVKAGLTQEKAAEACGVSIRSWQYYEAGKITPHPQMAQWYMDCLKRGAA